MLIGWIYLKGNLQAYVPAGSSPISLSETAVCFLEEGESSRAQLSCKGMTWQLRKCLITFESSHGAVTQDSTQALLDFPITDQDV